MGTFIHIPIDRYESNEYLLMISNTMTKNKPPNTTVVQWWLGNVLYEDCHVRVRGEGTKAIDLDWLVICG